MKKPQSKIGLIFAAIYLLISIVGIIYYSNCGGFLCGMEMLFFCYPWCWYEFLTFLPSFVPEILVGILINSIIIYYIGYFLQDVFSKNKLPKSKFLYFFSILTIIFQIFLIIAEIFACNYYYAEYNILNITIAILFIAGLVFLLYLLRNKQKHWFFFLNLFILFLFLFNFNEFVCNEIKIPLNSAECNNIKEMKTKRICFQRLVKNEKNIKICDDIIEEEIKIICCYISFEEIKNLDVDDALNCCNQFFSDYYKFSCYKALAEETKNLSICDNKILDKNQQRHCYRRVFERYNDLDYKKYLNFCNNLTIEGYADYEKEQCYIDVAVGTMNTAICSNVSWNDYEKEQCIKKVREAIREHNDSLKK